MRKLSFHVSLSKMFLETNSWGVRTIFHVDFSAVAERIFTLSLALARE